MSKLQLIETTRKNYNDFLRNDGDTRKFNKEQREKWVRLSNIIGCVSYLNKMKKSETTKIYDELKELLNEYKTLN